MLLTLLSLLASSAVAVPQFTVDLDVEPEERWKEVILYYKDLGALEAMTRWDPAYANASAPPVVQQVWLERVQAQLDEEYERELQGWMKYGGFNVTREGILLNQVGYEMNYPDYCSGIVAAMPNGTVVHGRNMDYQLELEINGKLVGWPELTVDVTFLRGGRPLMTSVTWPFQLGIHTAMRFDGWTFEQNTRRLGDDLRLNTAAAQQGGAPSNAMLVRRVMERVPDFETAVQELWSAHLSAPMYFIMTGKGPYEAAVLSMDRGGVHEPSSPPLRRLSKESGTWRLLQTNDDVNKDPLDPRRPMEEHRLEGFVQTQVNPEWVFTEMHERPIKNNFTVFTWIAVPETGFHKTVLPSETLAVSDTAAEVGESTLGRTFLAPRRAAK